MLQVKNQASHTNSMPRFDFFTYALPNLETEVILKDTSIID